MLARGDRVFPKTCALLRQWLPSKPGLPWTSDQNEQAAGHGLDGF